MPSPPLGPVLGQRGINIMKFCKEFNALCLGMHDSIPLLVYIYIYTNNEYKTVIRKPLLSYIINTIKKKYLVIDVRYIYEISKYLNDNYNYPKSIESECKSIISYLKSKKIKVV